MKKLIPILFFFISYPMISQSIAEYRWKNRLIVIFTESAENPKLHKQLNIFESDLKAFKERKLLLMNAVPGKKQLLLPERSAWESSKLYVAKKETEQEFEIILLGLDGGVKLRENELVPAEKIFNLIDSMPMRQAEMRKQN